MKLHEDNAVKGDIYTTPDRPYANAENEIVEEKGKVIDLVFPIVVLIIFCICGMLYTGGFFSGTGFVKAFSASDASVGLMLGSFFALVVTVVFYAHLEKYFKFRESMDVFRKDSRLGTCNPDPDICMDIKSNDRQSWRSRVCG